MLESVGNVVGLERMEKLLQHEDLRRLYYGYPLCDMRVSESFSTAFWGWFSMMVTFHSFCAFLEICDRKRWLVRFRRQPAGDNVTYFEMLPRVLFNQVFMLLVMLFVEHMGWAYQSRRVFISWPSFVGNFIVMAIGHDALFYFGHRFVLHSKWGFKHLGHSLHHSTKANSAISSFYMASLDFVLEILLPFVLPMFVMGNEAAVLFCIVGGAAGAVGGLYEHSGYDIAPKHLSMLSTTAHHFHHSLSLVSFSDGFGSPGFMDNLFQTTYRHFLERSDKKSKELRE